MTRRRGALVLVAGLAVLAAGAGWWATAPAPFAAETLPADHAADAGRGERFFHAGGCASCHAAPDAEGADRLALGGGLALDTPFGVFVAPNISPHREDGIGAWSDLDFVNAMQRGVSPAGRHYYPAFPYGAYAKVPVAQILDLKAYLDTLPPVAGVAGPNRLTFPYSIRRGVGLWKRLHLDADFVARPPADAPPDWASGRLLVEGWGHCGECHTPRGPSGGLDRAAWLEGAPSLDGPGRVPALAGPENAIADWSRDDIAYYLESGFTPEFDSVGGSMVDVVKNTAQLPAQDRAAIAAYLKSLD